MVRFYYYPNDASSGLGSRLAGTGQRVQAVQLLHSDWKWGEMDRGWIDGDDGGGVATASVVVPSFKDFSTVNIILSDREPL